MENENSSLFIIFEHHLFDRYSYTINKYNYEYYLFEDSKGIQFDSSLSGLMTRIHHRKYILNSYDKLNLWLTEQTQNRKIDQLYLSSSEGYIAFNMIAMLKRDFPDIKLIALQHGYFNLSKSKHRNIKRLVNKTIKTLFNIYPVGLGFGEKIAHKYIVYNDDYKDFLVNSCHWKKENVVVDLNFLKSELYDKKNKVHDSRKIALFALQSLSKSGLTTIKNECYLNDKTAEYLCNKYDLILIKEHPAGNEKINFKHDKLQYTDNLIDALNMCDSVYSYTSTVLIDATIFDAKCFAIQSNLLNVSQDVYKSLGEVVSFESTIDV